MNDEASLVNTSRGEEDESAANVDPEEPSLSFLTAAQLQVFETFVKNYSVKQELLREDAIALDYMFGPAIQQVFEMLEEDQVCIRRNSISQRVVVEVCGQSSGETYWVPPGHAVCQCMSFAHGKRDFCKHILAAHLFLAITPNHKYKEISNQQLDKIFNDFLDESS